MREIKFRAWNDFKGMITNPMSMSTIVSRFIKEFRPAPTGFGSRAEEVKPDDYILMQYTGLKDKNGKEIYEGDVLRIDFGEKYEKKNGWPEERRYTNSEVEWSIDAWSVFSRWNQKKEILGGQWNLGTIVSNSVVIGNIYENHKLLN